MMLMLLLKYIDVFPVIFAGAWNKLHKKLHAGHNKKSKARYTHGADEHQCKKAHDRNMQKISCAGRHNHEGKPPGMDKINSCLVSNNSLKMFLFFILALSD
jgi:hypothetical protein